MRNYLSIGWRPEDICWINVLSSEEKKIVFEIIFEVWVALFEKAKDGYRGDGGQTLKVEHWRSSDLSDIVRESLENYFSSLGWEIVLGWREGHVGIAPKR